ncbi:MAG: sulfur carrier protein ThiS [Flammeovirgaceae bacterium]|nr:sulfur carrier protein ThiS [Flammeovirgaceae bacterium]
MKILVNNKAVDLNGLPILENLIRQLDLPIKGTAIAINNEVIPKNNWNTQQLHENDQLLVITATQGG